MTERKTDGINLRMSPATKELLRLAAAKEHRTLSNMLEFLILDHCERNSVSAVVPPPKSSRLTKPKGKSGAGK